MSDVAVALKRELKRKEEALKEKISPKAKRIRVLKVWALGPSGAESLIKWMKEGGMLEELLKENMELRSRYINLEAKLTVLADRIAVQKLSRIFRAAREAIKEVREEHERED